MSNNTLIDIFYHGQIYKDSKRPSKFISVDGFVNHLKKLVSYPYTGTNLKDGQVVVEGVDYELSKRYVQQQFSETDIEQKIAIPKEQPTEKKEETQEELWEEVVSSFGFGGNDELALQQLQNKFTITRK